MRLLNHSETAFDDDFNYFSSFDLVKNKNVEFPCWDFGQKVGPCEIVKRTYVNIKILGGIYKILQGMSEQSTIGV